MRIESNVRQVIAQVHRLKANIPIAMGLALAPQRWEESAKSLAQNILLALATPQERRFIPAFIDTLAVTTLGEGILSMRMRAPVPELREVIKLAEAQAARGSSRSVDLAMGLFDKPIASFEDLILQWVQALEADGGKRRDARDLGKTDEEIAHLISYIMLSPQVGPKGLTARNKLTPHIEAFLRANQVDQLPPMTVNLWLRAVLAGWRELVRTMYPQIVRQELRGL